MIFRKPDVVPPGNAVLREHHGGVVAEQRCQAGCECADTGGVQRADDDVLRAKRRRIVGRLDVCRELDVTDAKRQAVCLHGFQMRPAHHAGHLMPGQCEPHRKMAADGADAEDTDAHGGGFLLGEGRRLVFTGWPRSATCRAGSGSPAGFPPGTS